MINVVANILYHACLLLTICTNSYCHRQCLIANVVGHLLLLPVSITRRPIATTIIFGAEDRNLDTACILIADDPVGVATSLLLLLLSIIVIFVDANCCLHKSFCPCSYRVLLLFQLRRILMMLVASICYHQRKPCQSCLSSFGAGHLHTFLALAASISLLLPVHTRERLTMPCIHTHSTFT